MNNVGMHFNSASTNDIENIIEIMSDIQCMG